MATDADRHQFDELPPLFASGLPVDRTIPPPGDPAGGEDRWPMVA